MFDYSADAELFPQRSRGHSKQIAYRRFDSAARALKFAMEDLPPALLAGTFLEVNEERLGLRFVEVVSQAERAKRLG